MGKNEFSAKHIVFFHGIWDFGENTKCISFASIFSAYEQAFKPLPSNFEPLNKNSYSVFKNYFPHHEDLVYKVHKRFLAFFFPFDFINVARTFKFVAFQKRLRTAFWGGDKTEREDVLWHGECTWNIIFYEVFFNKRLIRQGLAKNELYGGQNLLLFAPIARSCKNQNHRR